MSQPIQASIKSSVFNFELNRSFSSRALIISDQDREKSLLAIHQLGEYVRYCLFSGYTFNNRQRLLFYLGRLMTYETCNQAILVKTARLILGGLLTDILDNIDTTGKVLPSPMMMACLAIKEYGSLGIQESADSIINTCTGRYIRASMA